MANEFKRPDAIVAKEKADQDLEQAVVLNEKDNELAAVRTAASQRLPFSKARSVALVATVAAAPFLSVRCPSATNSHRS
jgi:hypothetical protein